MHLALHVCRVWVEEWDSASMLDRPHCTRNRSSIVLLASEHFMANNFDLTTALRQLCRAAAPLAATTGALRNRALRSIAEATIARAEEILEANTLDLEHLRGEAVPSWELDSLKLTPERLQHLAEQLHQLAALSDPIGAVERAWKFENDLTLTRYRMPLGAIALAYEIYPEWCLSGIGMALKTGNSVVVANDRLLSATQAAMVSISCAAAYGAGIPEGSIQAIPGGQTENFVSLLQQSRYLKLVLACGRSSWVAEIAERAEVMTLAAELPRSSIYIDASATWERVLADILQHPALPDCRGGAADKRLTYRVPHLQFLLHADWARKHLDALLAQLQQQNCVLSGKDASVLTALERSQVSRPPAAPLEPRDSQMSSDSQIQIDTVTDIEEAIAVIDTLADGRPAAIVTESRANARRFARRVESSIAFVNRFPDTADIARSSTGTYLGLAAAPLPARGIIDLAALTTVKYLAEGD